MTQLLAGLPVVPGATLFLGVVVLLSVGGALLFHRIAPQTVLSEHNDIAGFVFAVVGVVYAVLLAFFAIGVWERFEAAEQRTYDEASRLTVVYRKADVFPQGHMIRAELRNYTDLVIDREWAEMGTDRKICKPMRRPNVSRFRSAIWLSEPRRSRTCMARWFKAWMKRW